MRSALFLVLLFLAIDARASIGDTPSQANERYGRPLAYQRYRLGRGECEERSYIASGMKITVTFWNGRSHREIYARDHQWRDREVQEVMARNSASDRMQVLSQGPTRVTWATGDRLFAAYNIRRNGVSFLTVSTGELARAEQMRTRDEWFWRY